MNIKQILVPTDLSKASLEGVKVAAHFTETYGGTVDLIHVIPLLNYYSESIDNLGLPFDMEKDIYPKALKKVNEKLHNVAEKYIAKEHRGLLINQVGRKPSNVIAEQANNGHYDLIIMSNKGGHEGKYVRSNITEKVIRLAKIPVLSIDKALYKKDVNHILVPVDGSNEANAAIIPAFQLAENFDADLSLLHIIEPYSLGMEVLPALEEDDEAVYHTLIKKVDKYFEKQPTLGYSIKRGSADFNDYIIWENGSDSVSIKFQTIVKKGFSSHNDICEYADEKADLVVMSTYGRTGIARVLLGSTTGMVAQHLKKPLLTLRPKR